MFQMPMRILVLLCCLGAVFSGCAFSKNKDKDKPKVVVGTLTDSDSLSEEELKVEVVETQNFDEYFVRLSWPQNKIVRVEVQDGNQFIDSNGAKEIRLPIGGGLSKNLLVTAYNSLGGFVFRKSYAVTAPDDLVVETKAPADVDVKLEYNRIRFAPNSKLFLNGHNLDIRANYIDFGIGTMIVSNDENRQMPTIEFLLGSKITINAKRVKGQFEVHLIGFDGYDGRSGNELDQQSSFIDKFLPELKGSPGEAGASKSAPAKANDGFVCTRRSTDGGQGKSGAEGTRGEDAGRGGDAGSFEMNVENPGPFGSIVVEVVPKPGNPGKPGRGGDGRRGGEGGDPGASVDGCPAARRGPEGPRGPKGKDGRAGLKGEVGTIRAPGVDLRVRGSR